MNPHTERVLEYKEVIELIAVKTTNIYGREYIESRKPLDDPFEIASIQAETAEAMRILDSTESFIIGQLDDIRDVIVMARKGRALETTDILKVSEIAVRSRLLKKYLSTREFMAPRLREQSVVLEIFSRLETEIKKAISPEGHILDRATPKLEAIRKNISVLQGRVNSKLDQFLRDSQYRGMLQDPIITRREHRFVVPVKQEFRSQFPGLVLDTSASGATLFMEPTVVLQMTNELKFQASEEKREEELIRKKLSALIADVGDELLRNIEFLGRFDSLQAAARFYYDYRCILPRIPEEPVIDLLQARHPLLGKDAVPIDIIVGDEFLGLIITGPNTGGKTVSLKTVGLLTMLALSGFPIPAGEGSRVGIFTNIFVDIGDEQSISQSLSTFSSHMTQIIRMIPEVDSQSLVLLDEVGAGTDPSEGVALASGLLKFFMSKKVRVIASTHYNELKHFASHNENFRNAAVEFNEETLQPTYKISIGLPGRSCALKIASRLGLKDEIIQEAEKALGSSYFKIEALLSEIDREKNIARKESEKAGTHKVEMEKLKGEYDQKLQDIDKERQQVLDEARKEGQEFIDMVLGELRETRKEWRKSLKEYKKGGTERDEVREKETVVKSVMDRTLNRLKSMRKKEVQGAPQEFEAPLFCEGDTVSVIDMGKRGQVAQMLNNDTALIQLGNIKMEIPIIKLEKVTVDFSDQPEAIAGMMYQKAANISTRVDIRGTRAEEAIQLISKHIDDACLANLSAFEIVHGKGTGALRKAVQEYLRSHRSVKSFRDGELHEGGWGVTVVNI